MAAGATRQYTAIFAIGAKLQGSFRGAMVAAQARLRSLQHAAMAVGSAVKKMALMFSGLFAGLAAFGAAAIFKKIFEESSEAAIAADQRTRRMTMSLLQLNDIRKRGRVYAGEQVEELRKHNELLAKQQVYGEEILDAGITQLAVSRVPPKRIAEAIGPMADLLAVAKGVNATQEDMGQLANAFGRAIRTGMGRPLREFGLILSKQEQKTLSTYAKGGQFQKAFDFLMERMKFAAGSAAELMKTPQGRIKLLSNEMDALAKRIGGKILPIQARMADQWRKVLPHIEPLITASFETFGNVMGWVGEQVDAFLKTLYSLDAWAATSDLSNAWSDLVGSVKSLGEAMGISVPQGLSFGQMLGEAVLFSVRILTTELHVLKAAVDAIKNLPQTLADIWKWLMSFSALSGVFQPLQQAFADLVDTLKQVDWGKVFGGLLEAAKVYFAPLLLQIQLCKAAWDEFVKAFPQAPGIIKSALSDIGKAVVDALLLPLKAVTAELRLIQWGFGFLPKKWQPMGGGIPPAAAAIAPTAKAAGGLPAPDIPPDTSGVPGYQHGGIVTRPTLAMLAERGPEAVVPLGALGSGGTNVTFAPNITVNGNMGDSERRALNSTLRDLSRDFIEDFKRAQAQERRLSYESGYG
jgi:hypothetical protein